MKNKYIKYKKQIRSFLSLGATLSLLGLLGIISKTYIFGVISLIIGIINLLLYLYNLSIIKKIEERIKEECISCQNKTHTKELIRYFINGKITDVNDFNSKVNESDFKYTKNKHIIHYYYCLDCKICLTEIMIYQIKNNKEILLSNKTSVDFNYNQDY